MRSMDEEIYKSLRNDHIEIDAIRTEHEQFVKRIQEPINFICRNISQSGNDESNGKTHWNALDAYNFKRQQIIKNIVLRIAQTQESRQKFIDYCRTSFHDDESKLKQIDEFEKSYKSPDDAVKSYTADSFVFRLINKTFRSQNTESIEKCHYFIIDLSKSLRQGFDQLVETFSTLDEKKLTVYRAHGFSSAEYDQFCSPCEYITFNSYLSTTSDIDVAKFFGGFEDFQVSSDTNFIQILFHIEIDLDSRTNSNVIVADIRKASVFDSEQEYLFDFGATFKVVNIDCTNRIIKLIATDKPHHVAQTQLGDALIRLYATQEVIDLIPTDGRPDAFSESLLQIDKGLNRLDVFEAYILETCIDDKNYRAACEYCIKGRSLPCTDPKSFFAREWRKTDPNLPFDDEYTDTYNKAIEHFQLFYEYASGDLIEWAVRALGFAYFKISNYKQSEKYFNDGLKLSHNPVSLVTCYYFLACIYGELEDYHKSTDSFNSVLRLDDKIPPFFIAATYCQMLFYCTDPNTKKDYLSKALSIYQGTVDQLSILKCRSELINLDGQTSKVDFIEILDLYFEYCDNHQMKLNDIVKLYEDIGFEYYDYLNYDQALECYEKIIPYLSDDDSHYETIVDIYIKKKDSKSAINYLEKSLRVTKDPKKAVKYWLLMGIEYSKQNNHDKALECLMKSAAECDQPTYNPQATDYLFGWELRCKSYLTKCISLDSILYSPLKLLYFYTKAVVFASDVMGLYKSELIHLFKLIDKIYPLNSNEQITQLLDVSYKNNENHLKKLIYERIFDNYIFLGDHYDQKNLVFYVKALDIYKRTLHMNINRDIELLCISKINRCSKTNLSYDILVRHIDRLFETVGSAIETQDEEDLFLKECQIELKKNTLANIHSSIGDIYIKQASYEQAKLFYDKSLGYYETFPALFHLDIADLYSKQGDIIYKQQEEQTQNDIYEAIVAQWFGKAFALIAKYEHNI